MNNDFDNQTDATPDLWAAQWYPLCTKFGLRIIPRGPSDAPAGIPFDALKERLQATGHWGRWCEWGGGGLTAGRNGIYPEDVESFLAGKANDD